MGEVAPGTRCDGRSVAMRRLAPALLCLLAARAAAEEPSLADYLPADTPVYFEMRRPTAQEMETLAMARVFKDPRMKALIGRVRGGDGNSFSSMRFPLGDALLSVEADMLSAEDVLVNVSYADPAGERSFRVRDRVALAVVDIQAGPMPVEIVAGFRTDGDAGEAAAAKRRSWPGSSSTRSTRASATRLRTWGPSVSASRPWAR